MVTNTPPTFRSQLLAHLLPVLAAAIRATRMRPVNAEEAMQESLIALIPHLDRLATMPERDRSKYVWRVGIRTAMAVRQRIGLEQARGTGAEVVAWELEVVRRSTSPEEILRAYEGAEKAAQAFHELDTLDRQVVSAVRDEGLSEREAARKLGVSLGSVGYHLRYATRVLARALLETTSEGKRRK